MTEAGIRGLLEGIQEFGLAFVSALPLGEHTPDDTAKQMGRSVRELKELADLLKRDLKRFEAEPPAVKPSE